MPVITCLRRIVLNLLLSLVVFVHVDAQPPAGYYDAASGLTGTALQQALHNIIKNHNAQSYNSLYQHFQSTDRKPDLTVWDMYSDVPGGTPPYVYYYNAGMECGNYTGEGQCYNREHSFPTSWFGGNIMPMYSDLFHIYPTDGYVNNRRANYPFATVGTATWTSMNGSKLGNSSAPGYSGVVFEPINEYKGDFARTMFYMAVRYYSLDASWPGSAMTTGSQLKPWALAHMITWHQNDPVSTKEINRNNAVYAIQNNRNPFIDHPEFVNLIWGATAVDASPSLPQPVIYPVPVTGKCHVICYQDIDAETGIWITDITGRRLQPVVTRTGNEVEIDLSTYKPGCYLIGLQLVGGRMAIQKILKQ